MYFSPKHIINVRLNNSFSIAELFSKLEKKKMPELSECKRRHKKNNMRVLEYLKYKKVNGPDIITYINLFYFFH